MNPKFILIVLAFVIFILAACDFPAGHGQRMQSIGLALFTLSFLIAT
jgi:hypothetical protein